VKSWVHYTSDTLLPSAIKLQAGKLLVITTCVKRKTGVAGLESGSTQGVSTLLLPLLLSFLVQLRLQNLVELIELDGLAELDEFAELLNLMYWQRCH